MALRPVGTAPFGKAALFRSRQLVDMDAREARFIADELKVRAVYDLRGAREIASAPEPAISGVKTIAYAPSELRAKSADRRLVAGVIGEYGKPGERMVHNYRRYVEGFALMGPTIRSIANEGSSALVHCVNGKDRTGVLCAVMERIAGVCQSDIMEDYLATNEANKHLIASDSDRLGAGMNRGEREILMSFLEARSEYLQAFFDEVIERYGSFDRYVEECLHISRVEREAVARLVVGAV